MFNGKADKEGHVAGPIDRRPLPLYRGVSLPEARPIANQSFKQLVDFTISGHVSQDLSGFFIKADGGYGRREFLMDLTSRGASGIFIMPEH